MIATFTRFDVRNLVTTQSRRVIILVLFVIALGIALPVPAFPIITAVLVVSVSASYPFQADERGLLDTLYATAALTRRSVVIGRYLTLLVYGAVMVGIAIIVCLTTSAIRHQSADWPLIGFMLAIAFGILALALAIQLPFYFALGYTKSRAMIYIPVGIISVASLIATQSGLLDGTQTFRGLTDPASTPVIAVLVLVFGCAVLAASMSVAARLYRRREL